MMMDENDQNDDSSEDDLELAREQFKRKAVGSPDNNVSIENLTRQEKKKLKKSLNKSR